MVVGMPWMLLLLILVFCLMTPLQAVAQIEEQMVAGMVFRLLPAGCFQMGSPVEELGRESDEGPRHEVCLDAFWIGQYEVTQGVWMQIMGRNPAYFKQGESYPVEQVSWQESHYFIQKLNARGKGQFHLPTEAQWEYAARAGETTPFAFGRLIDSTTQANYNGTLPDGLASKGIYRQTTTAVGHFLPNAFGLYDMHGNVSEWIHDWYCANFYQSDQATQKNPVCKDDSSGFHVLRGGSWYDEAKYLRSADRGWSSSDNRAMAIGLRLVWFPASSL